MFIIKCLLLVMTLPSRLTTAKRPRVESISDKATLLEDKIKSLEPFESEYKKEVEQICAMSSGLERFVGLLLGTLQSNEQYQKAKRKDKPMAIARLLVYLGFRGWHQTTDTPAEKKIEHIKQLLDSILLPQDSLQEEDDKIFLEMPQNFDLVALFHDVDDTSIVSIHYRPEKGASNLTLEIWLSRVEIINEIVLRCIQQNCVKVAGIGLGHKLKPKSWTDGERQKLEKRHRLYQLRMQFYLRIAFFKRIIGPSTTDPPTTVPAEVSSKPTSKRSTSLVGQLNTTERGISKNGTKCACVFGSVAVVGTLVAVFAAIYSILSSRNHSSKVNFTTPDWNNTETISPPTSGWFSSYILWIAIAVFLLLIVAGVIIWYRRRWISTSVRSSEEVYELAAPGSSAISTPETKEAHKKRKPVPKRKQQPVQPKVAPSSTSTVFTSMQRAPAPNTTTSSAVSDLASSPLSLPATSAFPRTDLKAAKPSLVFKDNSQCDTVMVKITKISAEKKKKKHSLVAKTRRSSPSPQSSTPDSSSPGNR